MPDLPMAKMEWLSFKHDAASNLETKHYARRGDRFSLNLSAVNKLQPEFQNLQVPTSRKGPDNPQRSEQTAD